MANFRKQLGDILLGHRIITEEQLQLCLSEQKKHPRPLGRILVQLGFLTDKLLLQALAAQKGVSAWHLDQDPPHPAALLKLPQQVCREYSVLPIRVQSDLLILAMKDTDDIDTIELVRNLTGMRIDPVMAEEERLLKSIESCYLATEKEVGKGANVDSYVKQALEDFSTSEFTRAEKSDLSEDASKPVVALVNQVIQDAVNRGASDIHIEPSYDSIEVRYRLDGQLMTVMNLPIRLAPMLATRIKIMSAIDIVETRIPQDGRITAELNDKEVDLRVSVLPSYFGPRIVMRVLDQAVGVRKLDELGFEAENHRMFKLLIERPYGLFLVTGPTGSGKTTTLYAALNELRTGRNNVMTCEDPVEYVIEGVSQSQVNDKVGLTFASQLRAVLRQDPDVVLVGEIRDQETAETAIRASMTGHMVLSTLHTNDAPSSIPRLMDMGVDPYLISTSLVGVLSQRLLRVLCPHCKQEAKPTIDDLEILSTAFQASDIQSVFRPIGCDECFGTGYRGRMAVHELMPVTSDIARMVAEQAPMESIRAEAACFGYKTMQEDALRRIREGLTSVREAKRLIAFDTIERKSEHLRLLEAA